MQERSIAAMEDMVKQAALRDLRRIPGVGKSIACDLWDLEIQMVAQLDGADPEELYERLCALRGVRIDRCMLYVMRCAMYFAGPGPHDPALLNWWAWKDSARPQPVAASLAGEAARRR
jgi:hypothetical protein